MPQDNIIEVNTNPHIRQKGSTVDCYTVVIDTEGLLSNHPCMLENPEIFEVVNDFIPSGANVQKLNYKSNIEP